MILSRYTVVCGIMCLVKLTQHSIFCKSDHCQFVTVKEQGITKGFSGYYDFNRLKVYQNVLLMF